MVSVQILSSDGLGKLKYSKRTLSKYHFTDHRFDDGLPWEQIRAFEASRYFQVIRKIVRNFRIAGVQTEMSTGDLPIQIQNITTMYFRFLSFMCV
jgi:hypothetical protein